MKFSPQIHKHSLIRQIQTENISKKRPPAGPPIASNAQAGAIPLQMFPVTSRVHRAFYNGRLREVKVRQRQLFTAPGGVY